MQNSYFYFTCFVLALLWALSSPAASTAVSPTNPPSPSAQESDAASEEQFLPALEDQIYLSIFNIAIDGATSKQAEPETDLMYLLHDNSPFHHQCLIKKSENSIALSGSPDCM